MQQHILNNKSIVNQRFPDLLVAIVVSVMTVSAAADNNVRLQLTAGQSNPVLNPWALPQDGSQQYQENQGDAQYSGYRFVTPEILESLKQQQIQSQQVPGNGSRYQYGPPQSMPSQPGPGQSMQGYYGYPSVGSPAGPPAGTGSSNPLYNLPDVMHQGESFPWLPNAAVGGIPPINVQPLTEDNTAREAEQGFKQNKDNVFNPFTFGPNGNL
jgi:hypothetical protein